MLEWLSENISTIIIGVALLGIIGAVIGAMIGKKKRGESSCGCGCSSCAMHDSCHSCGTDRK